MIVSVQNVAKCQIVKMNSANRATRTYRDRWHVMIVLVRSSRRHLKALCMYSRRNHKMRTGQNRTLKPIILLCGPQYLMRVASLTDGRYAYSSISIVSKIEGDDGIDHYQLNSIDSTTCKRSAFDVRAACCAVDWNCSKAIDCFHLKSNYYVVDSLTTAVTRKLNTFLAIKEQCASVAVA